MNLIKLLFSPVFQSFYEGQISTLQYGSLRMRKSLSRLLATIEWE